MAINLNGRKLRPQRVGEALAKYAHDVAIGDERDWLPAMAAKAKFWHPDWDFEQCCKVAIDYQPKTWMSLDREDVYGVDYWEVPPK